MTPLWHDGPLAALTWDGTAPVAWRVADDPGVPRHVRAAQLVAHLSGRPVAEVTLARDPLGAPRVARPARWHVSLSHRGGHALIGAATCAIAVDREVVDDAPPLWDMLTPDEARAIAALPAPAQPRAWLRRWTIKEAHAKLVGDPRRLAPERIATLILDECHATAECEGRSRCWTRDTGDAIETVALWDWP